MLSTPLLQKKGGEEKIMATLGMIGILYVYIYIYRERDRELTILERGLTVDGKGWIKKRRKRRKKRKEKKERCALNLRNPILHHLLLYPLLRVEGCRSKHLCVHYLRVFVYHHLVCSSSAGLNSLWRSTPFLRHQSFFLREREKKREIERYHTQYGIMVEIKPKK